MNFFQRLKPRLFKVTLTIIATMLITQYRRYLWLDSHRLESLFLIDSVRNKMRLTDSTRNSTGNSTDFGLAEALNEYVVGNSNESSQNYTEAGEKTISTSFPVPLNKAVLCPVVPPNLSGPREVITTVRNIFEIEKKYEDLEPGGMYKPKECKSRYVVALVIPYRNRPKQLSLFLDNIHGMLMKQQIDYGIFVIEQEGANAFNRGKLMNVGFVEASKIKKFDCFIFHDVDLIPEDDRNLYTCPEQPRHLSVAINTFNYRLPYEALFGGVCAFTREHFVLTNGFSNSFWGWGGEDDDMYNRVRGKNLHVSRYPHTIARYTMLPHQKQTPNPRRFKLLQTGKKMYSVDGLSNLEYERKAIKFNLLYTWILVDLHPPRWWLVGLSHLWKG